jgi:hypothetical protein
MMREFVSGSEMDFPVIFLCQKKNYLCALIILLYLHG